MLKRQRYGTAVKLVCLLFVFGCARVWAWGHEGHETIGAIADTLLTGTPAAQHLQRILSPGETLATAAVWADCAKGFLYCHRALTPEMQAFVDANPRHHNYHYTDVPFEETQYMAGAVGTDLGCRTFLSCISKGFGGFCSRLLRLRTGKLSSAFRLHGFADIF